MAAKVKCQRKSAFNVEETVNESRTNFAKKEVVLAKVSRGSVTVQSNLLPIKNFMAVGRVVHSRSIWLEARYIASPGVDYIHRLMPLVVQHSMAAK